MPEYKSNSNRSREQQSNHPPIPERRIEKVVTGSVHQQKKTGMRKALNALFPGDIGTVIDYILTDALLPSVKGVIHDIICNSADIMLGETRKRGARAPSGRVSYREYYPDQDDRRSRSRVRSSSTYDYDDIIFDSRADAEEVLYRMEEMVNQFGNVSVGDMFDMVGLSCEFTANKYGWKDIRDARVERTGGAWRINLPMPILI